MGSVMKQAIQEGLKTELPMRLADFFVSLGPRVMSPEDLEATKANGKNKGRLPTHCEDVVLRPHIMGCFPKPGTYSDAPMPEMAAPFIFPDGMRLQPKDVPPRITTFVLTDEHRVKIYGTALTFYELLEPDEVNQLLGGGGDEQSDEWPLAYSPRSIAVLGHYPFFHAYSEFLKDVYHSSLSSSPVPLERLVQYFMLETPLPPLGKVEVRVQLSNQTMLVSRPPINRLPMVDFSYRPLFNSLSVANVLLTFRVIAAEFSVTFISSNRSLLTPVQEGFLSFLFPLVWQGVYIPILPRSMLDILDAPVPVIIGVEAAFLEGMPLSRRPRSMIFVDLDENQVFLGATSLSGLTQAELADLFEEAANEDSLEAEARADVLSFVKEPAPPRQTKKLAQKLEEFGGCMYMHSVADALIESAGQPFPRSEHLTPLSSFAMEEGSVVTKEAGHGHDHQGQSNAQAATRALRPLLHHSHGTANGGDDGVKHLRSILDPCNNVPHSSLFESWDSKDTFDAGEIRAAFLRYFVSLFLENDSHYSGLKGDGDVEGGIRASVLGRSSMAIGKRKGSVMSYFRGGGGSSSSAVGGSGLGSNGGSSDHLSEHGNAEPFFQRLKATQMFSQFDDERRSMPDLPEIRFFEESLREKQNRSKMTWNKNSTPFLSDTSDEVQGSYSPPLPSVQGIADGQRFEYARFPSLQHGNMGPVRKCKVLMLGPEVRRKVHADTALARFVSNRVKVMQEQEKLSTTVSTSRSSSSGTSNGAGGSNGKIASESDSGADKLKQQQVGASEYRFDDLIFQGRQRYMAFLIGLTKVQALIRSRLCRLRYARALRAAVQIQSVLRGHRARNSVEKRRLLWRAAVSLATLVRIQALARAFVARSRYERMRALAVWVQAHYRRRVESRLFRYRHHCFLRLSAAARGFVVRRRSVRVRLQQLEELRRALLLLWNLHGTPWFQRQLVWGLCAVEKESFLTLALVQSEVSELYNSTGVATAALDASGVTAVVGPLAVRGTPKWHKQAQQIVPSSSVWKLVVKQRGEATKSCPLSMAIGKDYANHRGMRQSVIRNEQTLVKATLKNNISDADKTALYTGLGVDPRGKQKKILLLEAMWAYPESVANAQGSANALRSVQSHLENHHSPPLWSPQSVSASGVLPFEDAWIQNKRAQRIAVSAHETAQACFKVLANVEPATVRRRPNRGK
jgi:hypothetical protein